MPLPSTSSDFEADYGGEKTDYYDPVDPEEDLYASQWNRAMIDLSMGTRMFDQGWVIFDGYSGSGSSTLAVVDHEALWGRTTEPTVVYSVDAFSQATYTVTLPSTFTDALGTEHAINLRGAFKVNYCRTDDDAAGELLDLQVHKLGPYSFKLIVRAYDGTADAGANSTFTVHYK